LSSAGPLGENCLLGENIRRQKVRTSDMITQKQEVNISVKQTG